MKLKRNLFAFLIMVFTLSGCVSDVSVNGTLQNTKQSNAAANQLVNRQTTLTQMGSLNASPEVMRKEVASYATAQKLNTKFFKNENFITMFNQIIDKSDAAQYEPEEEIVEEDYVSDSSSESTGSSLDSFTPRITLYGVDCYGCNVRPDGTGNTATGIQMNPSYGVLQSNGSWLPGITYDGYYIIAADGSIPFYSIVEITNHGLTGKGISPDQPIKAIVLDRGGGVRGGHIDLYIGSETEIGSFSIQRTQPTARILRYGG